MAVSRIAALAEAFMAAPLEPSGWDRALRLMAEYAGAAHGQLVAIGENVPVAFNHITDFDYDQFAEFDADAESYGSENWRVGASRGPLEIVSEHDYAAARALCRSDFYDEFVDRTDIPFGCQTVLLQQPGLFLGLATLRRRADGVSDTSDRAAFAEAASFALAAARMQVALGNQGAMLIAGAFEAMASATFLLDGRGAICATTGAAEAMALAGDTVTIAHGVLRARQRGADDRLQAALRAGQTAPAPGLIDRFWLEDDPAERRLRCEVFALPVAEFSFGFAPRVLVAVRAPLELGAAAEREVAAMLSLTPAEAAVAVALAQGTDREAIAATRGSTLGTVNVQIKSLFRKLDVGREGELVAMLNRLLR